MARPISFSMSDDEEDLYQWMEEKYENGPYRSRSDVIVHALKRMRDEEDDVTTIA